MWLRSVGVEAIDVREDPSGSADHDVKTLSRPLTVRAKLRKHPIDFPAVQNPHPSLGEKTPILQNPLSFTRSAEAEDNPVAGPADGSRFWVDSKGSEESVDTFVAF